MSARIKGTREQLVALFERYAALRDSFDSIKLGLEEHGGNTWGVEVSEEQMEADPEWWRHEMVAVSGSGFDLTSVPAGLIASALEAEMHAIVERVVATRWIPNEEREVSDA